jgi:hypothetical protein
MISTVTTTTVSTVTTLALAGSLALICALTLVVMLIQKELTTAAESRLSRTLGRALNVGIVPLLIAFVLIVVVRVIETLK